VHRNVPDLMRIVVAIDPAVSTGEDSDETRIIVAGIDGNGHGYVLADQSGRHPPAEWARLATSLYRQHNADRIVAEVNNGGAMVKATGAASCRFSRTRRQAFICCEGWDLRRSGLSDAPVPPAV